MLRWISIPILIIGILIAPINGALAALSLFPTEQQAQAHCPRDTVVWLNLPSGIYHLKGQRYYGNTKSGAYVCKAEADASGDRVDRNGQ